jgi:hypothetical protein
LNFEKAILTISLPNFDLLKKSSENLKKKPYFYIFTFLLSKMTDSFIGFSKVQEVEVISAGRFYVPL